jgi:hypothetical protein
MRSHARSFVHCGISLIFLALATSSQAQSVNDGHFREWAQIAGRAGTTWNQLSATCPSDGISACANSEWVWATDEQVLELFGYYEPAIIGTRGVGGFAQFFSAQTFLNAFTPTFSSCGTYQCGASASGWTSTLDANGLPVMGSVSWGNTSVSLSGGFGVGSGNSRDESSRFTGAFFWRATGPGVIAYDDSGYVASPDGGVAVANVLANDWIDGARATTASVNITQLASSTSGLSVDAADGSVDVAPGTAVGTHTLTYQICAQANAALCDGATVTVVVRPYVIDAVNDSGTASPSTGGTAIANVLANDLLGGRAPTTSSVSIAVVTAPAAGITLNVATGKVTVDRGTAFGSSSFSYRICELANPDNCDLATVSVTVQPYVIDAVDDYVRASSKTGGVIISSVLANDRFAGAVATIANVTLRQLSLTPTNAGITLNTNTGAISIAPKIQSTIYALVYQICESAAPTNCDSTTATLDLSGGSGGGGKTR